MIGLRLRSLNILQGALELDSVVELFLVEAWDGSPSYFCISYSLDVSCLLSGPYNQRLWICKLSVVGIPAAKD